jgi:hypothetical protein
MLLLCKVALSLVLMGFVLVMVWLLHLRPVQIEVHHQRHPKEYELRHDKNYSIDPGHESNDASGRGE